MSKKLTKKIINKPYHGVEDPRIPDKYADYPATERIKPPGHSHPLRRCLMCKTLENHNNNFKLPKPNTPKAFVNLFCKKCLLNYLNDDLYKKALPFYNEISNYAEYNYNRGTKRDYS